MKRKAGLCLCILTAAVFLTGCGWKQPEEDEVLSEEDVRQIVLNHSKEDAEAVKNGKISPVEKEGTLQYELEFTSGLQEYEYDIDAYSGEILSFEYENKEQPAEPGGPSITVLEAKNIVLELAEAEDFECIFTRAEYRKAEAPPVFEIKFLYNGREYEFELFPDGTVRECSMEALKTGKGERGRVEK